MPHPPTSDRPETGRAVRLTSLFAVLTQIAIGLGCMVWAAAVRKGRPSAPADWPDLEGVFEFIAGLVVVIAGLPYAFLTRKVWTYRRWAVVGLMCIAPLQATLELFALVGARAVNLLTVAIAIHTALLTWLAFVASQSCNLPPFAAPRRAPARVPQRGRPVRPKPGPAAGAVGRGVQDQAVTADGPGHTTVGKFTHPSS